MPNETQQFLNAQGGRSMIPSILPASRWQRNRGKALPTGCRQHLVAALALAFFLVAGRSLAGPDGIAFHFAGQAAWNSQSFDVHTIAGLTNLITASEALIQLSETEENKWQAARAKMRDATPVTAMSQAELRKFFSEPDGLITRRDRRGLK
jgi:hypothetical protein